MIRLLQKRSTNGGLRYRRMFLTSVFGEFHLDFISMSFWADISQPHARVTLVGMFGIARKTIDFFQVPAPHRVPSRSCFRPIASFRIKTPRTQSNSPKSLYSGDFILG